VDDPPLVIVSTAQQLKSTVREPVMLMLSSFLRVLVVSALVHGVAARRAAGRDLSYQWVGFSNFYSFDENL